MCCVTAHCSAEALGGGFHHCLDAVRSFIFGLICDPSDLWLVASYQFFPLTLTRSLRWLQEPKDVCFSLSIIM